MTLKLKDAFWTMLLSPLIVLCGTIIIIVILLTKVTYNLPWRVAIHKVFMDGGMPYTETW